MSTVLIVLGVLLVIAIVLGLWAAGIYNSLVSLRNRFEFGKPLINGTECIRG